VNTTDVVEAGKVLLGLAKRYEGSSSEMRGEREMLPAFSGSPGGADPHLSNESDWHLAEPRSERPCPRG